MNREYKKIFFCCDIRTGACDGRHHKTLLYTNKFKILDSPVKRGLKWSSLEMITRKTDYAIRCVLYLAESGKETVMMNEIAEKAKIPKSFLAKILQRLAKAGIVMSRRGVKGGFKLAKKATDISLLDVVETMEGTVAMNLCAVDKKACSLSSSCCVHPVWVEIRKDAERRLRNMTFTKLLKTGRT